MLEFNRLQRGWAGAFKRQRKFAQLEKVFKAQGEEARQRGTSLERAESDEEHNKALSFCS